MDIKEMSRRHNIFAKPEEETFTYALLLARESSRKIPHSINLE
jgi:hypothetical protein